MCKDLIINGKHNVLKTCYDKDGKKQIKKVIFRIVFLIKCQSMFKKILEIENDNAVEDSSFVYKDKVIGCIKFIGELYNANLLSINIINNCIKQLYNNSKSNSTFIIACMCNLIRVVGKRFFKESRKMCNDKLIKANMAEECFNKLVQLKTSGVYKLREQFAVEDIIDLRKKEKW